MIPSVAHNCQNSIERQKSPEQYTSRFVWVLVLYWIFVCYFPCVVIDVVLVLLWLTGSFRNAVGVVLCVVTMGKGLLNITDVALLM